MTTFPTDTPLTKPTEDTLATFVLEDEYIRDLLAAVNGNTVVVNFCVFPTRRDDIPLGLDIILATRTGVTVTGTVVFTPEPSVADIVIVALPNAIPFTKPPDIIVAIVVSDDR